MTDTELRKTFLGIPITGDVTRGDTPKDQRPLEEFSPVLQALLNRPEIEKVRWEQYTPYFNDGDPCVFGAHGVEVKLVDGPDSAQAEEGEDQGDEWDEEDERGWLSTYQVSSGSWTNGYGSEWVVTTDEGYDAAWVMPFVALDAAVDGGEFDRVLLEAFGDHARVMVTRTEIQVEEYSHD